MTGDLRELLSDLQQTHAQASVIARCSKDGETTVTVRHEDGRPPLVYGVRRDAAGSRPELFTIDVHRDERLPGAWLLEDRDALARRLGIPRDELRKISLVAYRPGARAVARVTLGPDEPALFLKLLTKRGFKKASATLSGLAPADGGLHLVLPLRILEKERVLVARQAPGHSLHELLLADTPCDTDRIAQALRRFGDLPMPHGLPARGLEDERHAALSMLERGARVMAGLEAVRESVRAASLPDWPRTALVHGDLHDKQIFVAPDGVHLIDLEGACLGDPRQDGINLIEHCRLRGLQGGGRAAPHGTGQKAMAAFSHAFGLDEGDPEPRLVRGLVLARLAGVYALRPRWEDLARRLGRDAMAALEPRS